MGSSVEAAQLHMWDKLFDLTRKVLEEARKPDIGIRDDILDALAGEWHAIKVFVEAAELADGPSPVEVGRPNLHLIPGGDSA